MKIGLATIGMLISGFIARADYNSDQRGHSVRCAGLETVVYINKARTRFTVFNPNDVRDHEAYTIDQTDTDGGTYVAYINKKSGVVLTFSNRSDTLDYQGEKGAKLYLTCPTPPPTDSP